MPRPSRPRTIIRISGHQLVSFLTTLTAPVVGLGILGVVGAAVVELSAVAVVGAAVVGTTWLGSISLHSRQ